MVLVKNRVNYFYYILSIKAAYCNPFCKRFIRGSYHYYTKIKRVCQADFDYFLTEFNFLFFVLAGALAGFLASRWMAGTGMDINSCSHAVAFF